VSVELRAIAIETGIGGEDGLRVGRLPSRDVGDRTRNRALGDRTRCFEMRWPLPAPAPRPVVRRSHAAFCELTLSMLVMANHVEMPIEWQVSRTAVN
jgi:hypothetical protein